MTFFFTDVEGSTRLLHALGAEGYADALAEHRRILREAFTAHGGTEVDTQGDAFFVAFPTATGAIEAAATARDALASGPIRVRIGLHTGTPHLTDEGYVGPDVHRAARIAAAGHGGQILVSSASAALLDTDALRDLGLHRLKDLTAPERIYQLGDAEFAPLKTLHQTNLPLSVTAFLGREAELEEVGALLSRDDVRLVTLTGPGGTGKTRLALQAAAAAADAYPGGVWWVPLAPLRDPDLVLESAASALGASGDLAEHIGDTRLLLLLDNFEHLVAAAVELGRLLGRCPNLALLVTSREPLHLAGEHEYAVDPLAPAEAVELFLTRAVAAKRDFSANGEVARICERLDHLPLAIELAAARVKLLSPRALLARLEQRLPLLAGGSRDAPDRQRTLRATIEWSHELLTFDEQGLFARLAVFRGGCTLEAAEAVADADLDTLQSLVDKSLVRLRGERFLMLETIREYAVERLEASGEADELRRRHAEHFVALAEEAEPHLKGSPRAWADRLDPEHDNLRGAFDWLEAVGEIGLAQRLAGAMAPFWYLRNHVVEGRRRLERVLSRSGDQTSARAKALAGAATMAFGAADLEKAQVHANEALNLYRQLGDAWGIASAAMMLGNAIAEDAKPTDTSTARRLLEESVQLFRDTGDEQSELRATYNLAVVLGDLGERDAEREVLEEHLRRARALGLERDQSMSLGSLAGFARREGRIADAASMLVECIRIERELGDLAWTANNLARLANTFAVEGRMETAATVLAVAEDVHQQVGFSWPAWVLEMNDETRTAIAVQFPRSATDQGDALTVDQALDLALRETE